jgi:hypothetical protein
VLEEANGAEFVVVGMGTGVTDSLKSFDLEVASVSFKVFERISMVMRSRRYFCLSLSVSFQCSETETLPGSIQPASRC